MSNDIFGNIISNAAVAASKANPPVEGDYKGANGLLYCGKCHTPKQCKYIALGQTHIVSCICKCKIELRDREKKAQEEAERVYCRELQRQSAFADDKTCSFIFELDDKRNAEDSQFARNYAAGFNSKSKWLFFNGNCGTGKSFYAACICNAVIDKGFTAKFTSISEIEREIWKAGDKNEVYDDIKRYDLLILDDFSAERDTAYMQEIAYNVIDSRLRSGKPIIITSNLTSAELSNPKNRTQERTLSRICENSIIYTISGSDRRKEKLKQTIKEETAKVMNGSALSP